MEENYNYCQSFQFLLCQVAIGGLIYNCCVHLTLNSRVRHFCKISIFLCVQLTWHTPFICRFPIVNQTCHNCDRAFTPPEKCPSFTFCDDNNALVLCVVWKCWSWTGAVSKGNSNGDLDHMPLEGLAKCFIFYCCFLWMLSWPGSNAFKLYRK